MRIGLYEWKVLIVDRKEIDNCDGRTFPNQFEIKIADDLKGSAREITFIHEVVHALLDTQGRCYQKKFDLEELCEFIAWKLPEINQIVEQFEREIGL